MVMVMRQRKLLIQLFMANLSHTIAILAYNNHELTLKNIQHLINNGYKENILLFDNGSNPSYKKNADKYGIRYQREPNNIYVNPAWNIIVNQENCQYLTLLNNDCFILSPHYFQDVLEHMKSNDIGISSCKTRNIIKLDRELKTESFFYYHNFFHKENKKVKIFYNARRQGWLMTLNLNKYKQMNFQIPDYVKLWFGDDWIWGQFLINNEKYGVYKNRYAVHIKNTTIESSKTFDLIVSEDMKNIDKFGDWYKIVSPKLHIKSKLFNKYI